MHEDNAAFYCSSYMFERVCDMLSAAKAMRTSGFEGWSSAYAGLGRCFLVLCERSPRLRSVGSSAGYQSRNPFDSLSGFFTEIKNGRIPACASEFGERMPDLSDGYIIEHCRCLIRSDAIKTLSEL